MTPEGKVKKMIKERLKPYGSRIYQHWPVLNGMGTPELDCNLIVSGYAISIEAKAPGEHMTKRQKITAKAKRDANGIVFEVDSVFDMDMVIDAIDSIFRTGNTETARNWELVNMENKGNG